MKKISALKMLAVGLMVCLVLGGLVHLLTHLPEAQAAVPVGAMTAKAGSGGVQAGRFVKLSAADTIVLATAATDKIVGVCELDANANGMTRYAQVGTLAWVDAGGTITVGDLLTADANSEAVALSPTSTTYGRIAGVALTADVGTGQVQAVLTANYLTPVGTASIAVTRLALADGKVPCGDANNTAAAVTLSGDATMDNAGAVTVAGLAGKLGTTLASTKLLVGNGSNVATAVNMSGDATMDNAGAVTVAVYSLGNGAVTPIKLSSGLQDFVPYLTVTGADDGDGTGTATIQVLDALGNNLAERCRVRTWIATSDFGAPAAKTDFSVTTGTEIQEVEANADYEAITDATGKVVMNIDNGGAGTVYVMAEIDGRIYSSGAISITST